MATPQTLTADELLDHLDDFELFGWGEATEDAPRHPVVLGTDAAAEFEGTAVELPRLPIAPLPGRRAVAPFVPPAKRRSHRSRRHDYRRLGFIELEQTRPSAVRRFWPRTLVGMCFTLLCCALTAGAVAASLYAYYDFRATQTESRTAAFAEGFGAQFETSLRELKGVSDQAVADINTAAGPLRESLADQTAVAVLPSTAGQAVWSVRTADTAGAPTIGSAFVVQSDASGSLFLTSLEVVEAAAAKPGPDITLERAGASAKATLVSWDPATSLALLKTPQGGLTALPWASKTDRQALTGKRLFAMSGFASAGAKAVGGTVIDQTDKAVQLDRATPLDFRGGPIVTPDGKVVAIASSRFAPYGFLGADAGYAPFVASACVTSVLTCPPGVD